MCKGRRSRHRSGDDRACNDPDTATTTTTTRPLTHDEKHELKEQREHRKEALKEEIEKEKDALEKAKDKLGRRRLNRVRPLFGTLADSRQA